MTLALFACRSESFRAASSQRFRGRPGQLHARPPAARPPPRASELLCPASSRPRLGFAFSTIEVHCPAHRDVLAQRVVRALWRGPLEGASAACRSPPGPARLRAAPSRSPRRRPRCPRPPRSRPARLARERGLGVGLVLADELLLRLPGHLEVLARDSGPAPPDAGRSGATSRGPWRGPAREACRSSAWPRRHPRRPRGTRSSMGPRRPRASATRCRHAARRASRAARLLRQVVVELRQALLLDLLHLHGERGRLPGELLCGVVLRKGELDLRSSPADPPDELLLEARDQPTGAKLEHEAAALAALEGLPSIFPTKSMTMKSPSPAARSTVSSDASDSRSALELCLDLLGRRPSARGGQPRRLVLAELRRRHHADLERELERVALLGQVVELDLRVAHGLEPASTTASSYQPGRPRRTASSSTASRPIRWSTTSAGTLPLRKPGTRISRPIWDAAVFSSRSRASLGTSTSTRTRESGSSVVLVFTAVAIGRVTVAALAWCGPGRRPRCALAMLSASAVASSGPRPRRARTCQASQHLQGHPQAAKRLVSVATTGLVRLAKSAKRTSRRRPYSR